MKTKPRTPKRTRKTKLDPAAVMAQPAALPPPPPARVCHIEVGRLYNLGNYENCSFKVAVEVPPGASATNTLFELNSILVRLRPIPKPSCYDSWLEASKVHPFKRSKYQRANWRDWKAEMDAYAIAKSRRHEALMELDALGGTMTERDAKNTWDDNDCDDPLF